MSAILLAGAVALGVAAPAAASDLRFVAPVAAATSGPDVTAVADARCMAGKIVLTIRATNAGTSAATITVTSAWGSKTHTAVAPGATVSSTSPVRASAVAAGTVDLTATDAEGSRASTAPFAAARCGAAPVPPVGTGAHQEIRNQQNTLCLDGVSSDTRPGVDVQQWTCQEEADQLWAVTDLGNGHAEIRNRHSGLCLQNVAAAAGSGVRLGTCSREDAQQWRLIDVDGGWIEIRDRVGDLCLQSVASPLDGAPLSRAACDRSGVQRWRSTDPNVVKMTYELQRSGTPTPDEADAYARITDAMDRAVARYNRFSDIQRHLTVEYDPGVATADATLGGHIRFGADRGYMQEGTALHEISHTAGVGTTWYFQDTCDAQAWPSALPLLRSWDGEDAVINCGGLHMWPYGLNYANEFSDLAYDRHVRLVQAMRHDGL